MHRAPGGTPETEQQRRETTHRLDRALDDAATEVGRRSESADAYVPLGNVGATPRLVGAN